MFFPNSILLLIMVIKIGTPLLRNFVKKLIAFQAKVISDYYVLLLL